MALSVNCTSLLFVSYLSHATESSSEVQPTQHRHFVVHAAKFY